MFIYLYINEYFVPRDSGGILQVGEQNRRLHLYSYREYITGVASMHVKHTMFILPVMPPCIGNVHKG